MDAELAEATLSLALRSGDEQRFLEVFFDHLGHRDADGPGITREAFGDGENAAFELVQRLGLDLGLDAGLDAAGNLVLRLPGAADGAPLMLGSHLDTVPQGGNYDGAAGVAGALLVLARLRRADAPPLWPIELIVLRAEESPWFERAYVGSLALWGGLSSRDLERPHRRSGIPLAACLDAAGADLPRIRKGRPLRAPETVRAYIEIHIEQGPLLVARDFPVAPVTAIRGNRRFPANRIVGAAGHSGAIPRWLRHDAVFAFAELVSALDEHWKALLERGIDLVVTVGVVHTNAIDNSLTRIPGELAFSLEFRSQSETTLTAFEGLVRAECEAIGARRGVTFELDEPVSAASAVMDAHWREALFEAAIGLDVPTEPVPSGAGHDAAVFAGAGVPSAMLFVRNEGGSHNPDERMDLDDLLVAVDVLHRTLLTEMAADRDRSGTTV